MIEKNASTPCAPSKVSSESAVKGVATSDRERQLEQLAHDCLAMLRDLHANFGWDELHATLEDVEERAAGLGIRSESEPPHHQPRVLFHLGDGEERTVTLREAIEADDDGVRFAEIFRMREDGERDGLTLTGDAWRTLRGRLPDALKKLEGELVTSSDMEDALRAVVDWAIYRFQHCGQSWTSAWSCAANDECPECGAEIEPLNGEEIVLRRLEQNEDGHFNVNITVF